jgi:hypothetical protein
VVRRPSATPKSCIVTNDITGPHPKQRQAPITQGAHVFRPRNASYTFGFSASIRSGPQRVGKQTFTLSPALVQGWINDPSTNNGILIGSAASIDGFQFSSRETTTSANRPQLNVTYTVP